MSKAEKSKVSVRNRKAEFEFEILAKFIAGMVLAGSEIKSIRNHKASIAEAYCAFAGDDLVIRNMNIEEYSHSTYFNHEPRRDRKLLLQKSELNKLRTKLKDKGLTIVPLHLFISDSGYAKVEIALAKGKKLYDKRESLKDKDLKRNLSRSDAFRD
ncbi:MAG: SsrA-binding protein SmpB [Bacteroidetes bacterium]|nr:SsrA-binding protein SmpB [Bacteroidota bacterium]